MRYALPIALLLLIVGSIAYAQDQQLTGIASSYWTRTQTFAGVSACFTDEAGDCALFPAANSVHHRRRVIAVKSSAAGVCCWVGDPAATIDATGAVTAGGDHGTGPGACMVFRFDGDYNADRPSRTVQRTAGTPGTTDGLCPTAVGPGQAQEPAGAGDVLHAPCTIGGACAADHGGGTCAAATSARAVMASEFLVCNLTGDVTVTKMRQLGPEEN